MKRKTFRSFYLSNELNERLQKQARLEDTSASRIVRLALDNYLKQIMWKENVEDKAI